MIILSGVYRSLITTGERVLSPGMKKVLLWDHPAGVKTIHFWAPIAKWGLVIAGIGDMMRPADKLSKNQTISLCATGTIWSRYAMVIKPKNYALLAVNSFLAFVAVIQFGRIYMYEQEVEKKKKEQAAIASP